MPNSRLSIETNYLNHKLLFLNFRYYMKIFVRPLLTFYTSIQSPIYVKTPSKITQEKEFHTYHKFAYSNFSPI